MESRIKMLREKRGLIQELLAVEIGVTQQMLSKYEKDITIIKVDPDHIYINSRCRRKFIDESGRTRYGIDEYMKRRMETKLITKILGFKIQL